ARAARAPARAARAEGSGGGRSAWFITRSGDRPCGPAPATQIPRCGRRSLLLGPFEEPVADAHDGVDPAIPELAEQRSDVDVDGARLDVGVIVPEAGENRVASDHPAAVLHQVPEQIELLFREPDEAASDRDLEAWPVDSQTLGLVGVVLRRVERRRPPEVRRDTRDQLLHGERLRQVVV